MVIMSARRRETQTHERAVARHIQHAHRRVLLILPVPRDLAVLVACAHQSVSQPMRALGGVLATAREEDRDTH